MIPYLLIWLCFLFLWIVAFKRVFNRRRSHFSKSFARWCASKKTKKTTPTTRAKNSQAKHEKRGRRWYSCSSLDSGSIRLLPCLSMARTHLCGLNDVSIIQPPVRVSPLANSLINNVQSIICPNLQFAKDFRTSFRFYFDNN